MSGESPESAPPTILVVDDEPSLRDALTYTLRNEGYRVVAAANGVEAIQAARRQRPQVVVLDVMLPGIDGLQVCRTLRSESTVPILLLSAKGEEIDRVVGLEVEADDYLPKSFAMRELLARIRAMLRRVEMMTPQPNVGTVTDTVPASDQSAPGHSGTVPVNNPPIVLGDLTVDQARRVANLGGVVLSLRPKEFELLHYLARSPEIVHSRDELLRRVWGYDFPIDSRTVDVHVRRLRQKIELDPSNPTRLETARGVGNRLIPRFSDGT